MTRTPLVPPHDADAEKSLIGSLLLDPSRLDEVVGLVTPESFYFAVAGRTFRAIRALADAGQPVDSLTTYERLRTTGEARDGDDDWIVDALGTVPHAAHAVHYAEIVNDRAIRRRLLHAAHDTIAAAHALEVDIDDSLQVADSVIGGLIEARTGGDTATDFTSLLLETLRQLQSDGPRGVSTGFRGLDRLGCTLKPGTLTVLAARSSCGKTSFAGNLALNLARSGTGVLFVSLEQSNLELCARFLSAASGVPNLVASRKPIESEVARLLEGAGTLQALPLVIDDTSNRTVSQIAAVARLARRKNHIGCAIVDYIGLVSPANPKLPRVEQVAEVTRGLRSIARTLEIPVVALCQLNRGIEARDDKRPRLSDLRESGSIEQDADQVWFIDRPATYQEQADPTEAFVIVGKHRNGRTGTVPLAWNGGTMTFSDREERTP